MDQKKNEKEKRETPIIDGDARPDMPVDPQEEKDQTPPTGSPDKQKFTSERVSDLNSLEDYKDAQ
jgi:hypothetical protein